MDYDICGRILRCVYDIFRDNGLSEYTIKKTYLQVPIEYLPVRKPPVCMNGLYYV